MKSLSKFFQSILSLSLLAMVFTMPVQGSRTTTYNEIGPKTDCNISDLVVEYECDGDDIFYVTLDFNIENPGNEGFKVFGNGIHHGNFDYADLPITIGPLAADCHTHWAFAVKDLQFPHCAEDIGLGKICCGAGSDCKITELVAAYECEGDSLFYVTLDFNVVNPGNEGFKVFGNGMNYGTFDYADLPITIGPLHVDCKKVWEFAVKDNQDSQCFKVVDLGKICCEGGGGDCKITELVAAYECKGDSLFYVTLNFDVVNPGNEGFKVFGNGMNYGTFDYADLPITIGPLHVDCKKVWEFAVKDNQDSQCFKVVNLGKVCCNGGGGNCKITELEATYECDGDSLFYVTLNFNVENPGKEGFKVFGNGMNYGTFDYADLPITIGPLHVDCKKVWEFAVKDNQDSQCFKVVDIGKVCCEEEEFQIKDLKLTKGACLTDTTYQLLVNFKHEYGDPFIFKIWLNGHDYGSHTTEELPILFDVKASVSVKEKLQMCMAANPGQCMVKYYDAPKCIVKSNSWISNENQEAAQSASSQKLITNDTGSIQFLIGSTMYNFKSSLSIKEVKQVSVLDLTGRIIYSQKTDGEGYLMTLDVPFSVASGLYYIKVDTDSGSEAYQFILMR